MTTEYRVVTVQWQPKRAGQRRIWAAARRDAGDLWSRVVVIAARIRRWQAQWAKRTGQPMSACPWRVPRYDGWCRWAYRTQRHGETYYRFPNLCSASTQACIKEYEEACKGTRQKRQGANAATAWYPSRRMRYRDVTYSYAAARLKGERLYLPNRKAGTLVARLPKGFAAPGTFQEAQLCYDRVRLVFKVELDRPASATIIGVDLNVNTLIAATDGERAVVVSGREVKATVQWRNKRLSTLAQRQSSLTKGSRRYKRLQRRKGKLLVKARNRVDYATHKASRIIAEAFPGATAFVGKAWNEAAQTLDKIRAQQVSQTATGRLTRQLAYKLGQAEVIDEAYTSQTCPVCGERTERWKRREFVCKHCGARGHIDVVGAQNILALGQTGEQEGGREIVKRVTYRRVDRRSSGEPPGNSSGETPRTPTRGRLAGAEHTP